MSGSLPPELEYLKPAIDHLSGLPEEDLGDEDLDLSVLEQALLARIEGLSDSDGQQLLQKDMDALRAWLNEHGEDESVGASYICEWTAAAGDDLIEIIRTPPCTDSPFDHVHYETPIGYSINVKGELYLSDPDIFCGCIWASSWFDSLLTRLQFCGKPPKHYKGKQSKAKLSFGPVSGIKIAFTHDDPVPGKRIEYLLKVPGGRVHVSLNSEESQFDESVLEQSFTSLRVEK